MIVLKIIGWVLLGVLALILLALCIRIRIAVEYSDDNTNVRLEWLFLKIPLYPRPEKAPKEPQPPEEEKKKKEKKKKEPTESPAPAEAEQPAAPSGQGGGAQTVSSAPDSVSSAGAQTAAEEPAGPSGTETSSAPAAESGSAPVSDGSAPASDEGAPAAAEDGGKPAQKKESLLHVIYRTHGVDGILEIVRRVFSYLGSFFGDMMKSLVIEELYLDIGCTKKDAAATAIYYGEVCSALYPMLGALASQCKIKKYDINVYPDYLARFSRASFFVRFHVYPIYVTGITVVLVCRMVFKVLLRMLVKIFLPKKEKKAEKSNKITEKEDESHEGSVSSRNPVHNDRESTSAG